MPLNCNSWTLFWCLCMCFSDWYLLNLGRCLFLTLFLLLSLLQMSPFNPLLCTPLPSPCAPFPLIITPLSMLMGYAYMFFGQSLYLLSSSLPFSLPSESCQSIPYIYVSGSILFISLFCSLGSKYK